MSSNTNARSRASRHSRTRAVVAALVLGIAACGYVSAGAVQDVVFASSFEDGEPCPACPGAFQVREWPLRVTYGAICSVTRIYGVVPGDEFTFTTCVPPGYGGAVGTGDPKIESVFDSEAVDNNAANDDCDPDFVPHLVGWSCLNSSGEVRMSCAPPGPEGIIVRAGVTYLDVTICPFGPDDGGNAPLHILWQGTSNPNPG